MRAARAGSLLALAIVASACGGAARADDEVRTVYVTIRYSSFSPGAFTFSPGETVRFVVENTDPIDHEFLIGDRTIQVAHEQGTEAYHPPRPGEMTVPAGTTQTTLYTFGADDLILGCHLPGHYAYGMRAPIHVA